MSERRSRQVVWVAGIVALQLLLACSKRCRDPIMLPYPMELHAYMKPYRLGSWWVYENTTGIRDSVYLTEYKVLRMIRDERTSPCRGIPITDFALKSIGMDTAGMVYFTYSTGQDAGAWIIMAARRYGGRTLLMFGLDPELGFGYAQLIDTTIASLPYSDLLRVYRRPDISGGMIQVMFLAKNVGVVGYVTQTDTFTLTSYHIP